MATPDEQVTTTFDDPNAFSVARREQLKSRRQQADALTRKAMESNGQMVGRVYVGRSPLENLAQGLAGGYMGASAAADEQALEQQQRRQQQQFAEELAAAPDDAAKRRILGRADAAGLRTALQQQFMTADEQRAFREQEARAARTDKAEQRQLDREARADQATQQREFQAGQNALYKRTAEQLAAATGANQRERFQLVTDKDGVTHRVNMDTGEATPVKGVVKATPQTKLNAQQQKALDDADVFLGHIDNALGLIKENPSSLGLKTMIHDAALQRLDPEGVATRAAVGGLAAEKVHQLSGAAVSAAEFKRLRPYLPAEGDSTETATKKLQGLRKEAERIRDSHRKGSTDAKPQQPASPNTGSAGGARLKFNPATGKVE